MQGGKSALNISVHDGFVTVWGCFVKGGKRCVCVCVCARVHACVHTYVRVCVILSDR